MKRLPILLPLLLLAVCAFAADGRLFYSREFPGSKPDYIQVTLSNAGDAEYREAVNDDLPVKFKLPPEYVEEIYSLAAKLDGFKKPLESPLKVAFMGTKTFRLENGAGKAEVKYNYTENKERTAKYDRLGVVNALALLESALMRDRVVAAEQFLPLLDRIVANENYMHTARVRASEIAEGIRAMKQPAKPPVKPE
jgi:hypothetical protein